MQNGNISLRFKQHEYILALFKTVRFFCLFVCLFFGMWSLEETPLHFIDFTRLELFVRTSTYARKSFSGLNGGPQKDMSTPQNL